MSSNPHKKRNIIDLTNVPDPDSEKAITDKYKKLLYFKYLRGDLTDIELGYFRVNEDWHEEMRGKFSIDLLMEEEIIKFLDKDKQFKKFDASIVEDVIEVIRIKNMSVEDTMAYCGL
jgi:hypothetical protein